jgi:hypothetical protein
LTSKLPSITFPGGVGSNLGRERWWKMLWITPFSKKNKTHNVNNRFAQYLGKLGQNWSSLKSQSSDFPYKSIIEAVSSQKLPSSDPRKNCKGERGWFTRGTYWLYCNVPRHQTGKLFSNWCLANLVTAAEIMPRTRI